MRTIPARKLTPRAPGGRIGRIDHLSAVEYLLSVVRYVMRLLLLFTMLSGVLLAADPKDWKNIANISGTDRISDIHIGNLLESNDIDCVIEGSLLYGISVPPGKVEQATKLLRTDARKVGYYVWFGPDDVVKAAEAKQLISRATVSSVLKKSEYGADTALGRFLRTKDVSKLTVKYPYIVSFDVRERQYLATAKTYSTGYDVEIELQKSLDERADGYRGSYQVYDSGNRIELRGSNEWRFGAK